MIKLKIILIVLISFLASCRREIISSACPPIVIYSIEEQKEIDRVRKIANSIILDKVLIDYGNLRDKIRICNGIK